LKEPEKYYVETLDMKDPNWKDFDFSKFDVVFHVAGIAHVSRNRSLDDLYYKINKDLAIETAILAKQSKVKQFIFMSSMIIYGKDNRPNTFQPIDTMKYEPQNAYGFSKLEADLTIQSISDKNFIVTILRSPIIYGYGCKGNFPKLVKFATFFPIFPKIHNLKSMIYIHNLSQFVKYSIDNQLNMVIYPQNRELVSTNDLIKQVRVLKGKKYRESRLLAFLVIILSIFIPTLNKIYGNKYYNINDTLFPEKLLNFSESLLFTIQGD
jgi:UDP-glucose 4-epimerase